MRPSRTKARLLQQKAPRRNKLPEVMSPIVSSAKACCCAMVWSRERKPNISGNLLHSCRRRMCQRVRCEHPSLLFLRWIFFLPSAVHFVCSRLEGFDYEHEIKAFADRVRALDSPESSGTTIIESSAFRRVFMGSSSSEMTSTFNPLFLSVLRDTLCTERSCTF